MGQGQSEMARVGIRGGTDSVPLSSLPPGPCGTIGSGHTKNGIVNVKVTPVSIVRGQIERSTTFSLNSRGGIIHGQSGNPDALISVLNGLQKDAVAPAKVMINDSRAHELLVHYSNGWYLYSAPEYFSRHSGTCLVVGDKSHRTPPIPVRLGDCLRLGSVGVVVSEMKGQDGVEHRLDAKSLQYLREEALALDVAEEEACLAANEGGFDFGPPPAQEDAGQTDCDADNGDVPADGHLTSALTENGNMMSKYFCYMCYESHDTPADPLVAPCQCKGDTRYLHVQCLRKHFTSHDYDTHTDKNHFSSCREVVHVDGQWSACQCDSHDSQWCTSL